MQCKAWQHEGGVALQAGQGAAEMSALPELLPPRGGDMCQHQLGWCAAVQAAALRRRVRVLQSAQEALALAGPKVVLASVPPLSLGHARQLFPDWAADPRNLILFPTQPPVDMHTSTAASLPLHCILSMLLGCSAPHEPSNAILGGL